jgi:hypothetical protein
MSIAEGELFRKFFFDFFSAKVILVRAGFSRPFYIIHLALFLKGLFTRTVILTVSDVAVASDTVKITVRVNRPLRRPKRPQMPKQSQLGLTHSVHT